MLKKMVGRLLSEITSSALEQCLAQAFRTALSSIKAGLLITLKRSLVGPLLS